MLADLRQIQNEIKSHLAITKADYASAKAQAIVLDQMLGYVGDQIERSLFEENKETSSSQSTTILVWIRHSIFTNTIF